MATLWEGRVTQFGSTPQVYRQPCDATTARVFSDPPMNFTRVVKAGDRISFGDGQTAPATGALAALADGAYQAGFRPDHLHLGAQGRDGLHFRCRLKVTEITGSETFLHLDHGADRWVGLIHGVQELQFGAPIEVWLDAAHVYVFAESGELVAPAAYAAAA